MKCPQCHNEAWLYKIMPDGVVVYTCVNPQCAEHRKPFNPVTGELPDVTVDQRKVIACQSCNEPVLYLTDKTYEMPPRVDESATQGEGGELSLSCAFCGTKHEFNVVGKEYVREG